MTTDILSVPTTFSTEMVAGDTISMRIRCLTPRRQPFDLSMVDVYAYEVAKSVRGTPLVRKDQTGSGISLTLIDDYWCIDVHMAPEDTQDLKGSYYHECEVRTTDGKVFTVFNGTLTIIPDLIHAN